jgi:8-oxo-dGTP diphosphatase
VGGRVSELEAPLPIFGERIPGETYVVRPSAYGILENNKGEIATVLTPNGTTLPGGGIEAGETPEEAVVREVQEECGLVVRPGIELARAVQFIYSPSERTYFEKRTVFLRAHVEGTTVATEGADHELIWLPREMAAARMYHESHAWVLGEFAGLRGFLKGMNTDEIREKKDRF